MEVFKIKNFTFSYPESKENALENLSLSIKKGDFMVICGRSGCGKSTLLRHMKTVLAPHGDKKGEILFCGVPLENVDRKTQSEKIGFVSQSPENQIVTDKVWHELAFGLESLGYETAVIRGKVAETAAFFGIEKMFHKNVSELSGGQKQLLNLASIMAMQPEILVLDEPTSQLDPIAAAEFLSALKKINDELGVTVVLTEHRLEEAFPLANRVVIIDDGCILCDSKPEKVGKILKDSGSKMFISLPSAMRIWGETEANSACPLTVSEGRSWLAEYAEKNQLQKVEIRKIPEKSAKIAVEISGAWFRYEKGGSDILRGLDLKVKKGEFLAILGGNGAGKTTTLKLIGGLNRAYRGEIKIDGKTASLPQNPQTLFVKKTVCEDLQEMLKDIPKENRMAKIACVSALCRIKSLLERHPYDLSGGEQQRVALAKILLIDAEILLLDEPTKGCDAEFKRIFGDILRNLLDDGMTIIMVSHDVEFCAEYADRCAMFFDGNIVASGTPQKFFGGNNFYTTSASRMSRNIVENAVTVDDLIFACTGKMPEKQAKNVSRPENPKVAEKEVKKEKLPLWRNVIALISGIFAVLMFVYATKATDLSKILKSTGLTEIGEKSIKFYGIMIVDLLIFAMSVYQKSAPTDKIQVPKEKRKIAKRTAAASILILFLIPITLFFGVNYVGISRYYVLSLAILIECMLPFFMVFEGRKPQARELVVVAVLCALGIAGRAAFFMLPQFKPVAAVVIISGIALGGETGFIVGAVTMLVSNIMFSQGSWTPFQMFAMGIIGFISGIFFRKGLIRRTRISICTFGVLSVILIYGGIMNPAAALNSSRETLNMKIIISYYVTGFPLDLVHALSTAIFLWFGALPILEKLDRIKTKYGLAE